MLKFGHPLYNQEQHVKIKLESELLQTIMYDCKPYSPNFNRKEFIHHELGRIDRFKSVNSRCSTAAKGENGRELSEEEGKREREGGYRATSMAKEDAERRKDDCANDLQADATARIPHLLLPSSSD